MRTRLEELRKTHEERLKEGKLSRAEVISLLHEAYAIISAQQPWTRAAVLALASLSPAQVRQIREGAVLQVRGDALPPEALRLILDDWRETETLVIDPTGTELAHFARANRVCLAAEWYPFSLGGRPTNRQNTLHCGHRHRNDCATTLPKSARRRTG